MLLWWIVYGILGIVTLFLLVGLGRVISRKRYPDTTTPAQGTPPAAPAPAPAAPAQVSWIWTGIGYVLGCLVVLAILCLLFYIPVALVMSLYDWATMDREAAMEKAGVPPPPTPPAPPASVPADPAKKAAPAPAPKGVPPPVTFSRHETRDVLEEAKTGAGWHFLGGDSSPLAIAKEGWYLLRISGYGSVPGSRVEIKVTTARKEKTIAAHPLLYYRGPINVALRFNRHQQGETTASLGAALPRTGAVWVQAQRLFPKSDAFLPILITADVPTEGQRRTSLRQAWEKVLEPGVAQLGVMPLMHKGHRLPGKIGLYVAPPVDPETRQVLPPDPASIWRVDPPAIRVSILAEAPVIMKFTDAGGNVIERKVREDLHEDTLEDLRESFRTQYGSIPQRVVVSIQTSYSLTAQVGMVFGEEQ